ncbi:MAG: hypothetical protein KKA73_30965 [Chloroflexi bacterium]|nr:hypothetical protein [Chloroflexota bacterium]MBU1752124.1 hypothetical protein [Chloroflexota bacterium]
MTRYLILGSILWLLLANLAIPAVAHSAVTAAPWPVAGVCLQPADPDTSIVLRSLRVEITLVETESVTRARVWGRFTLVNPSRTTTHRVTVGLAPWSAGDRFFQPANVQGLRVTVNDVPVTPIVQARPQVENETWPVWEMTFDVLERQFVEVSYTTPLEDGPVPRVAFALSTGAMWDQQIESAAVVVTAPDSFQREQILDAYPADAVYDGQQLSWYFLALEPTQDVGFSYITGQLWGQITAARALVTADPTVANRLALARIYLTLADRETFFAQAVAQLEQAIQGDAANIEARRLLAQAYEERGLAQNNAAYLELAIRYWGEVRALDPADATVTARLRQNHHALAQTLVMQQAYEPALTHLDAALALPAAGSDISDATLIQVRDEARRAWAAHLFANDQATQAVSVLRALGEPYETDYQAYAPALAGLRGQITTRIQASGGTRRITVAWVPFATDALTGTAALPAMLQAQVPQAQVQLAADGLGIEVGLAFGSVTELREMLQALGQGVPPGADWDPVRAVLTSGSLSYDEQDTLFWWQARYRESVPLREPALAASQRRQNLAALIADLSSQASHVPEDPLVLRLAALQSYAAALDRLLAGRVSNQVTLTGATGALGAAVETRLGEDKVLEAQAHEGNLLVLALVGGSVALMVLLAALLAWRRFGSARTDRRKRERKPSID